MKRQLRYGTNVVYNGGIYRIISAANTEGVKIVSLKTGEIITVKKSKLIATPHDRYELIKYKKGYYIVKNITCGSNNIPVYELDYANKFYDKNSQKIECVNSSDPGIQNIPSDLQEKLLSFLKFVDRYNLTISYLNKKNLGTYQFLDCSDIENTMDDLIVRCKLKFTQLSKIEYTLKKTRNPAFQIHLLTQKPFDFITQELQLITFDKAEYIAAEFNLQVDFKIKCEKWTYCLFNDEKTFYIRKFKYLDKFKKFCKNKNEAETKYLNYIENNVIIDKIIEGKEYKTTNQLLEMEREMTDTVMDLFYDINYEIPTEEIQQEINKFEVKRRLQLNNPSYSLEKEQKNSVIKSIQNKLSIITGYPGTGKTEIVRCITQALRNLFHKNSSVSKINSSSNGSVSSDDQSDNNTFSDYNFHDNKNLREDKSEYDEPDKHDDDCEDDTDEELNKYVDPKTIALLAPTGLAFLNLQKSIESNNYNDKISGTCHKVLYNIFQNIKIHRNIETCTCKEKEHCKYRNLKIKLAIIDETSMLDSFIFYEILQLCRYFNARLIVIGDVNQLPSIAAGTILKNLINSNCFDVTKLTNIKRQNAGSLVNTIKKMHTDIITHSKFKDDSMSILNIKEFIVNSKINRELLVELIKTNGINKDNARFITYFNKDKYLFNTCEINNLLQDIYNPNGSIIPSNSKYDNKMIFKISDKIIRTENDYSSEKMRANGEEALILDFDGKLITIQYSGANDKPETIGINELYENFKLNYCTTIHSAQGSQYDNVIFFIQPDCSYIIDKTSVYTAISRAKNKCIVISIKHEFIDCQKNNKSVDNKVSLFMRESNSYEL
jgi:ATP-dependent exoDNAse (exonuclease V) alpha subunit